MGKITIRLAQRKDAEDIAYVFRTAYMQLTERKHLGQEALDEMLAMNDPIHIRLRIKGNFFFVAQDSLKTVGVIGLRTNKQKTAHDRVSTFFIHPKYQSKGIGTMLFQTVLNLAKNRGVKKLYASSSLFAEPVYHHWGFKKIKTITNSFSNGEEYLNVWMEKDLRLR